ncbi:MAG: 3-deoxy-D-manno-octulosonic acid transferase [Pseudomonadota bacterium]
MLFLKIYQALVWLLQPLIFWIIKRRISNSKEEPQRIQERYGEATKKRPQGQLIWIHAASIGESRSILILIERLLRCYPHWHILVTTHTMTSARVMAKHLPPRAMHQYIPYDHLQWVTRFIDYWNPSLVLWVESELWPTFLTTLGQRKIPVILVNGRLSQRAFQQWSKLKSLSSVVFSQFTCCLTQSKEDAQRFQSLGANNVHITGNLKFAAHPLEINDMELQTLKNATKDRPVWLAASTHPGEEELVACAHRQLKKNLPNALCIIVPRHPARSEAILELLTDKGLYTTTRSEQEQLEKITEVYLADTLGELGLFYKLAPVAFIGGSLVPIGGHNLIEAAQLNCAIIHGPHMHKSLQLEQEFAAANAAITVESWQGLADNVSVLLANSDKQKKMTQSAKAIVNRHTGVTDTILQHVAEIIPQEPLDAQSA